MLLLDNDYTRTKKQLGLHATESKMKSIYKVFVPHIYSANLGYVTRWLVHSPGNGTSIGFNKMFALCILDAYIQW